MSPATLDIRCSSLDAYPQCLKKFHFLNFRRSLGGLGSQAMAVGTAVHAGIRAFWSQLGRGPADPGLCLRAAMGAWHQELARRPYPGYTGYDYQVTELTLGYWHQMAGTRERALGTEWAWREPLTGSVVLTAHMDLITQDGIIVDHKVVKQPWSQAKVDGTLQLTGYAFCHQGLGVFQDEVKVRIDCVVKEGPFRIVQRPSKRTLKDYAVLLQLGKEVEARGTDPAQYTANPKSWLCRICQYRQLCPEGLRALKRAGLNTPEILPYLSRAER